MARIGLKFSEKTTPDPCPDLGESDFTGAHLRIGGQLETSREPWNVGAIACGREIDRTYPITVKTAGAKTLLEDPPVGSRRIQIAVRRRPHTTGRFGALADGRARPRPSTHCEPADRLREPGHSQDNRELAGKARGFGHSRRLGGRPAV